MNFQNDLDFGILGHVGLDLCIILKSFNMFFNTFLDSQIIDTLLEWWPTYGPYDPISWDVELAGRPGGSRAVGGTAAAMSVQFAAEYVIPKILEALEIYFFGWHSAFNNNKKRTPKNDAEWSHIRAGMRYPVRESLTSMKTAEYDKVDSRWMIRRELAGKQLIFARIEMQ